MEGNIPQVMWWMSHKADCNTLVSLEGLTAQSESQAEEEEEEQQQPPLSVVSKFSLLFQDPSPSTPNSSGAHNNKNNFSSPLHAAIENKHVHLTAFLLQVVHWGRDTYTHTYIYTIVSLEYIVS